MSIRHPLDPAQFTRLPEPLDLDDTVTSSDSVVVAPEEDEGLRENEWLLRTAGLL